MSHSVHSIRTVLTGGEDDWSNRPPIIFFTSLNARPDIFCPPGHSLILGVYIESDAEKSNDERAYYYRGHDGG
jgi:hypothetical protein